MTIFAKWLGLSAVFVINSTLFMRNYLTFMQSRIWIHRLGNGEEWLDKGGGGCQN